MGRECASEEPSLILEAFRLDDECAGHQSFPKEHGVRLARAEQQGLREVDISRRRFGAKSRPGST